MGQLQGAEIGEEVSRIYQAINALSVASQEPIPEIGYEASRYRE